MNTTTEKYDQRLARAAIVNTAFKLRTLARELSTSASVDQLRAIRPITERIKWAADELDKVACEATNGRDSTYVWAWCAVGKHKLCRAYTGECDCPCHRAKGGAR